MKITASKRTINAGRREDIMRERDAWDSNRDQLQKQHDEEYRQFNLAREDVMAPVRQELERGMAKFDKLQTNISVDTRFGRRRSGREGLTVRVQVNENNKFADDVALSWDMDIYLDDEGNPVKQTSSWSGMKATTAAQLESLRQTLGALEYLNSINWVDLLDRALPNWEDYLHTTVPSDRPNFEQQLMEVDLEDALGGDNAVKCYNWESSGLRGQYVWVQLIRETPSGYTGRVYYGSSTEDQVRAWLKRTVENDYSTQRIRKTTIKPVTPLTIVSVNDAESVSEE